ncbi:thiol reductant ABC exporter subunit CydD [Streptococcus halichoeri]|uniref:thiol reductant ABC exporter subunit CydD n=1 Tax=Streptococcus halichoeri TaxID=254785 RepID=UPI0013577EE6|nr:thiol reductant ABC exporter subunit CydD [Streptococcus halichoeri]
MLDKAVMRLSGIHQLMGLLAGLDFLQALFIIGQAYFLSGAITGLWQGQPLGQQALKIAGFLAVYLGRHLINFIKDQRLDQFAAQEAKHIRQQLLDKLFELGPILVQKEGSGNVITMALDGVGLVENYLHLVLNKMINMTIIPAVLLVFIFFLDWQSGLVLLLVFPLIILFMIILGYAAKAKADKQYASYQLLSNHFLDALRGIDTLRFFGLSKDYAKSIYQTSERFRKATMSTLKIAILSTFALDFFTTLSIAIVAVMLGLRLINQQILLFPALTVLILAPDYFLPVRDFSSDYHATLDGKNAFLAIQNILQQDSSKAPQLPLGEWGPDSQFSVANIAVDYDGKLMLKEAAFTVKGYQKIGIIGMSGSGKSTLINVLSGFLRPKAGSLLVNGQALSDFNQAAWRQQLAYIPQNPYIFDQTLRDNIAFYTPKASDAAILQAISLVGLDDLLAELPLGLDTPIGNGARSLSGGQAQRIALARAFLDPKRKILLFDEPTAHLDIETELELKEKMVPLMQDKLVFFATHRLHWLHQMDLIMVLEGGDLVELGTYQDLMAQKGHLYRLRHAMGGENA